MVRSNYEVGALLQEYADLLSITGGEPFKVRVYEKAARAVAGYPRDVAGLAEAELRHIPNVGKSIAEKVTEYLHAGRMAAIEELRAKIPAGVRELTTIPTLGPKKAMLLHEQLGVSSVGQLMAALDSDKLRELKGFGPKTEENIRHGIALVQQSGDRVHVDVATELAEEIVEQLRTVTGCADCAVAGSLRRKAETVGDIDILAAAEDSAPLMDAFAALPMVAEVIARGPTKTSIIAQRGWLTADEVINAWPLRRLRAFLHAKPAHLHE